MKTSLLFLILMIFCAILRLGESFAQTTINYSYDNAGNRTYRGTIIMTSLKSAKVDSSELALLREETDIKKEVLEEKLGDQKILIYPNPTKGELKVDISGLDFSKNSSIVLYNQSGKLIVKKNPITGSDIINISSYPDGMYIMRITVGEKTSEWKILKE